jgi:hypothetical protein
LTRGTTMRGADTTTTHPLTALLRCAFRLGCTPRSQRVAGAQPSPLIAHILHDAPTAASDVVKSLAKPQTPETSQTGTQPVQSTA